MHRHHSCARSFAGRLLVLCLIVSVPFIGASACSCVPQSDIWHALEQADAVFAGRVVSLALVNRHSDDPTVSFAAEDLEVTIAVHSQWKGDVPFCTTLYTTFTCCTCGFDFEIGEAFLIYAYEDNGLLRTSTCTRTKRLLDAAEDLVVLGQLHPMSFTPPETKGENE